MDRFLDVRSFVREALPTLRGFAMATESFEKPRVLTAGVDVGDPRFGKNQLELAACGVRLAEARLEKCGAP